MDKSKPYFKIIQVYRDFGQPTKEINIVDFKTDEDLVDALIDFMGSSQYGSREYEMSSTVFIENNIGLQFKTHSLTQDSILCLIEIYDLISEANEDSIHGLGKLRRLGIKVWQELGQKQLSLNKELLEKLIDIKNREGNGTITSLSFSEREDLIRIWKAFIFGSPDDKIDFSNFNSRVAEDMINRLIDWSAIADRYLTEDFVNEYVVSEIDYRIYEELPENSDSFIKGFGLDKIKTYDDLDDIINNEEFKEELEENFPDTNLLHYLESIYENAIGMLFANSEDRFFIYAYDVLFVRDKIEVISEVPEDILLESLILEELLDVDFCEYIEEETAAVIAERLISEDIVQLFPEEVDMLNIIAYNEDLFYIHVDFYSDVLTFTFFREEE